MNKEDRLFKAMIDGHISEEQYLRGEEGLIVGDYVVKDDSWSLRWFGGSKRNIVVKITSIEQSKRDEQRIAYYFDSGTHISCEHDGSVRIRLATSAEIEEHIIRRGRG